MSRPDTIDLALTAEDVTGSMFLKEGWAEFEGEGFKGNVARPVGGQLSFVLSLRRDEDGHHQYIVDLEPIISQVLTALEENQND